VRTGEPLRRPAIEPLTRHHVQIVDCRIVGTIEP
jgi:hypothetical protein